MIREAHLIPCAAEEIASTDLQRVMAEELEVRYETYRVGSEEVAERGSLIFAPEAGRGGIAWSAESDWTDAGSAEEVLSRWLAGEMVE